ncbi:MAG TPA: class I SAM-dependent methyltransferase, partial [Blastocatellia bacterium]|nr:class I SAM-dependent methyltransferase [Blastocatellia bacterium]
HMRTEEYGAMFELEERLWWYEGMRAITATLLEPGIGEKGHRLLDIGCGTGYSLVWLRERFSFREVYGVDLSPHASVFWKKRGLDTVSLASADRLPFGEGEFDLVTCFDVVYQLNDERASAALSEMNRVLRPGGMLFIREPAYQWMRGAHDVAVGTHRRYTLTDLRRLLLAHGFNVKRTTYANTLLFWLAAPHRLLSKWRGSTESDVKPVPRGLNAILQGALKLEARMLSRVAFPFGLSAIALAEKRSR